MDRHDLEVMRGVNETYAEFGLTQRELLEAELAGRLALHAAERADRALAAAPLEPSEAEKRAEREARNNWGVITDFVGELPSGESEGWGIKTDNLLDAAQVDQNTVRVDREQYYIVGSAEGITRRIGGATRQLLLCPAVQGVKSLRVATVWEDEFEAVHTRAQGAMFAAPEDLESRYPAANDGVHRVANGWSPVSMRSQYVDKEKLKRLGLQPGLILAGLVEAATTRRASEALRYGIRVHMAKGPGNQADAISDGDFAHYGVRSRLIELATAFKKNAELDLILELYKELSEK